MVDKKYSIHPIITLGRVDIQYLWKSVKHTKAFLETPVAFARNAIFQ